MASQRPRPHCFIPRSHESKDWDSDYLEWFDTHNRKPDADVAAFCAPPKVFTGHAGTCFLEDTRGLHKGFVPKTGSRLLFEIVYTLIPKGNETYTPVKCPVSIENDLARYASRLLYQ